MARYTVGFFFSFSFFQNDVWGEDFFACYYQGHPYIYLIMQERILYIMTKAKKKLKIWQTILLIFSGVFILAILLLIWLYYSKLSLIQYDTSNGVSINTEMPGETEDMEIGETSGIAEITLPSGEIYQNENVVNILLLGTDERSSAFSDNARADSIMLLSVDRQYHTVRLVSFERAIGVPVPGRNDDWLTHTFRYGGANLTLQTVRESFCIDVKHYIRTNFYTFEQIVDTIGGIELNFTAQEAAALQKSTGTVLKEGLNYVSGKEALAYCRLRSIDSDWIRIRRQRDTIQAILTQIKTLSLFDLNKLLDKILPLVKTNLTMGETAGFLVDATSIIGTQAEQLTIPAQGTYWGITGIDGRSMYACDYEENRRILRSFLYAPYL